MAEKETLHCAPGKHDWTREKASGRKPTSCPAHDTRTPAKKARDKGEPAPPLKRKAKAVEVEPDGEPLTALERAAAFLDGRGELVDALKLQRAQLQGKLEEIDAMVAELEGASPASAKVTQITSSKTKVVRGAGDKCRHEVDRRTCAICADRRQMLDEAAQARTGGEG